MTWAAKTALFLGGLFAMAALTWMIFLPSLVERELRAVTGFDVKIEVLTANPFTGHVTVGGLRATNPPGYPSPDFIGIRELRGDLNEFSWLFTDRLVIDDLYINLEAVQIVREKGGKSNAAEFMAACSRQGGGGGGGSAPAPRSKPLAFIIKTLRLRVDRLVIADYTLGSPEIKTYNLNIDHTYKNVTQARQLLVPDVIRSLYSFGLRRDAEQLLPGEFGRALADAVGAAAHVGNKLKDTGHKTGQFLKGLLDKLEQTAKP